MRLKKRISKIKFAVDSPKYKYSLDSSFLSKDYYLMIFLRKEKYRTGPLELLAGLANSICGDDVQI